MNSLVEGDQDARSPDAVLEKRPSAEDFYKESYSGSSEDSSVADGLSPSAVVPHDASEAASLDTETFADDEDGDENGLLSDITCSVWSSQHNDDQSAGYRKGSEESKYEISENLGDAFHEVEAVRKDVQRKRDKYGVPGFRALPNKNHTGSLPDQSWLTEDEKMSTIMRHTHQVPSSLMLVIRNKATKRNRLSNRPLRCGHDATCPCFRVYLISNLYHHRVCKSMLLPRLFML